MSKEEAKVVVRDTAKPAVHGFQSDEAKAEFVRKAEATVPDMSEPEPAEIQTRLPEKAVAVDMNEMEKLVRVRPRETIPSMRVGPRIFSFVAGKETLVPKYVQMHMEEKGLI